MTTTRVSLSTTVAWAFMAGCSWGLIIGLYLSGALSFLWQK